MTVEAPSPLLEFEDQPVQRLLPPLALRKVSNPIPPAPLLPKLEQPAAVPGDTIAHRWNSKRILISTGIAATGVLLTQTPSSPAPHEGKFQLVVESSTRNQSHSVAANSAIAAPEFDYETQARVLESPKIISPVVRRLQSQYPGLSDDAVLQNLKVTHEPGSNRLLVTYRDFNPEKVQVVLKQLAQDYLKYSRECHTGTCRAIELINQRLPQLQKQVAQSQQKLQTLQQSYGNQTPDQFGQSLNQRLQVIAQQKSDVQIRLTATRARALVLQRQLGIDQAAVDRLLQQDSRYSSLLNQFQDVAARFTIELSRSQVDAARVAPLKQQYTQLAQELSKAAQNAVLKKSSLQDRSTKYQAEMQLQLLQQWISVTYQAQVDTITQKALTHIEQRLQILVQQWAGSILNYAQAQQELKIASSNLELYQRRKVELQAHRRPQPSIRLIAPPG